MGADSTYRQSTVRPPRSGYRSTDRPGAAFVAPCWKPWTAPTSRRTAAPTRAKEAKDQPIDAARGGSTANAHLLYDTLGRPAAIQLIKDNSSDMRTAPRWQPPSARIRRLLADKGYGADWLRADLRKAGIGPVIPGTRPPQTPDPTRQGML